MHLHWCAFWFVRPQFRYFPAGQRLVFTDFTSVEQRNREGLRALDFAEDVGPERVFEAMSEYPILQFSVGLARAVVQACDSEFVY